MHSSGEPLARAVVLAVAAWGSVVQAQAPAPVGGEASTLTAIRREVLPEVLRVTLELEGEAEVADSVLEGPPRVFVDLRNTETVARLRNVALTFPDDVVRQIRVGHHDNQRTRVVLDLADQNRHSVYPAVRALPGRDRLRASSRCCRARRIVRNDVSGRRARPGCPPAATAGSARSQRRGRVLALPTVRPRNLQNRGRSRSRWTRSGGAGRGVERSGPRTRRGTSVRTPDARAARRRGDPHPPRECLPAARRADGGGQRGRCGSLPLDSRERNQEHQGARDRDLLPEFCDHLGGRSAGSSRECGVHAEHG